MLINPYREIKDARWLKTNFHIHAGVGVRGHCGEIPLDDAVQAYIAADYDVIAITNHNVYIPRHVEYPEIALLDGIEYSHDQHMLLIGTRSFFDTDHQRAINVTKQHGGFVVLCHPNWMGPDYWSRNMLDYLQGYIGIEILNAATYKLKYNDGGTGLATDKWDYLLGNGRKIWGFGSDDFHFWHNLDRAYNMVYAKSTSLSSITEAVEAGRFYASTGLSLESFSLDDATIRVQARFAYRSYVDTFLYRFVGDGGQVLDEQHCTRAEYTIDPNQMYVRVEVVAENGAMLFTQPVLNSVFFN